MRLLAEPDECRDETQEAQVSVSQLVEAGEDAAIVLNLADEALDQVALLVCVPINLTLFFAVAARRNDRFRALFFDTFDEVCRVVAGVGNQHLELVGFDECRRLRDVVTLAARQAKSERQAERVHAQVNLGRKAAATPA